MNDYERFWEIDEIVCLCKKSLLLSRNMRYNTTVTYEIKQNFLELRKFLSFSSDRVYLQRPFRTSVHIECLGFAIDVHKCI